MLVPLWRYAASKSAATRGRWQGSDLQQPSDWPWRESQQVTRVRYVRLRVTSPTYGAVTIIVHEPGVELYYLICLETAISAPRLMWAWKRRS